VFVAPALVAMTTVPLGKLPAAPPVVAVIGVPTDPVAEGWNPLNEALKVPLTGSGLVEETGAVQFLLVEQPTSGTTPGTIVLPAS
jgi:hypothetical protein